MLISQVNETLSSSRVNLHIETKGTEPSNARNVFKSLVLIAAVSATTSATRYINDINDALHSTSSAISIYLHGDNTDRNAAKTIAHGKTEKITDTIISRWPKEYNKELYSESELQPHYDAAKELIRELKYDAKDIANTDYIHIYPASTDPELRKTAKPGDSEWITSKANDETPVQFSPSTVLAKLGVLPDQVKDEVDIIVPHINDSRIQPGYKKWTDPLQTNDPQDKVFLFRFMIYHEFFHSAVDTLKNENLKLKNQIHKSILSEQGHDPISADSEHTLYLNASKAVADLFAIAKVQQDWLRTNKEKINNGQAPKVAPFIEKMINLREEEIVGGTHNSSESLREFMKQLSASGDHEQAELFDKLENATLEQLFMTTYDVLSKSYYGVTSTSGLNGILSGPHDLSFPNDYQKEPAKSIFDGSNKEDNHDDQSISNRL